MAGVTYSFTANTKAQSGQVNSNFQQLASAILPTFVFTVTGTLATGTSLTPALVVPANLTILEAYIYCKTVPTGAAVIVDINKNGTSIWSATQANRLTLPASDADGLANQTTFDTTTLAENDILTLDIDQIGSTISGVDMTVQLKCEWR